MNTFMVVCTFRDGTPMEEVFAVVAEEQAAVATLMAQGRVGDIRLALGRGTVFIPVFADDEAGAADTVRTLPMSTWWDLDVFPIAAPALGGAA